MKDSSLGRTLAAAPCSHEAGPALVWLVVLIPLPEFSPTQVPKGPWWPLAIFGPGLKSVFNLLNIFLEHV